MQDVSDEHCTSKEDVGNCPAARTMGTAHGSTSNTARTAWPRLLQTVSHDPAVDSAAAAALAAVLQLVHSADAPGAGSRSAAGSAAAFPRACLSRDALQALCQSLVCWLLCHR